jgi:hypothetical protein
MLNIEEKVYWTDVEFNFLVGHEEYGINEGGEVHCFVKCKDSKSAIEHFDAAFEE